MSGEELFKLWFDDSAEHALIWCHEWTPYSRGRQAKCETCGRLISAWPAVLEKVGPRFHVVCRAKCMAIGLKIHGPVPFGGHIVDNSLPAELAEWARKNP